MAAEYFNSVIGQLGDTDGLVKAYAQTLLDFVGQASALNWGRLSFSAGAKPIWEPVTCRWVASDGSANPVASYDGGATWIALGSATVGPIGFGVSPAGLTVGIGPSASQALPAKSSTWASSISTGFSGQYFQTAEWLPTALSGAGAFIAIGGVFSGSGAAKMIRGTGTAAWTDLSASIPSAINTATRWRATVSPTRWVAFPRSVAGQSTYVTSDDGATFTARTVNGGLIGGSTSVLALDYSAIEGVFMLAIADTTVRILTSTDGVTWALRATLPSNITNVFDIAHCGTLWAAWTLDSVSGCRILLSEDQGFSWRYGTGFINSAGNPGGTINATRLASNGLQFIAGDGLSLIVSQSMGLPAVAT